MHKVVVVVQMLQLQSFDLVYVCTCVLYFIVELQKKYHFLSFVVYTADTVTYNWQVNYWSYGLPIKLQYVCSAAYVGSCIGIVLYVYEYKGKGKVPPGCLSSEPVS